MKLPYTSRQGQYLAFLHHYTTLHGRPPAEADMVQFFRVTPPSVHQMIVTLDRRGLITATGAPDPSYFLNLCQRHRGVAKFRELNIHFVHHRQE